MSPKTEWTTIRRAMRRIVGVENLYEKFRISRWRQREDIRGRHLTSAQFEREHCSGRQVKNISNLHSPGAALSSPVLLYNMRHRCDSCHDWVPGSVSSKTSSTPRGIYPRAHQTSTSIECFNRGYKSCCKSLLGKILRLETNVPANEYMVFHSGGIDADGAHERKLEGRVCLPSLSTGPTDSRIQFETRKLWTISIPYRLAGQQRRLESHCQSL
jgi:hypothetical protein